MPSKYNKGFTILEVLVTVAILSTAVVMVLRSFAAALSAVRLSQNITLASALAEDKLWELEQNNNASLAFPVQGTEKLQDKDFSWSYETLESDAAGLKEIKFLVSWQEGIRTGDYSLDFWGYLPVK